MSTYDVTASCYIKAIPNLCAGSIISGGSYVGSAYYNAGTLRANIPGYDPTNKDLEVYNFQPEDAAQHWTPSLYTVSGGVILSISSGTIISSGTGATGAAVCPGNGYAVTVDPHTIVSWYWTIISAGSAAN